MFKKIKNGATIGVLSPAYIPLSERLTNGINYLQELGYNIKLAKNLNKKYQKDIQEVHPEVLAAFQTYRWPGNIRELENAIERAVVLSKSRTLTREDFSFLKPAAAYRKGTPTLKELEKNYILEILNTCNWNVTRAAEILGINRVTLHKKINRLGLKTSQEKKE